MGDPIDVGMRGSLNKLADEENAGWPDELAEIKHLPFGMKAPPNLKRVWRSNRFLVQEFDDPTSEGRFRRLSVQRVEHAAFRTDAQEDPISWDELMAAKSQCGYGDAWAVEVFPPDDQVVCTARMRHLFIVEDERLPFAWRQRKVAT